MTKDSKRKINRRLRQKITFVQKSSYKVKTMSTMEFLAFTIEKTSLKIRNNLRNCEPQTFQKNKEPQSQIQIKVPHKKKCNLTETRRRLRRHIKYSRIKCIIKIGFLIQIRLKLRGPHEYHFQHRVGAEHLSKLWKRDRAGLTSSRAQLGTFLVGPQVYSQGL